MPHVVHGDVIGSSRAAVFSVDGQSGCIRITCQIVQHGKGGGGSGDFGIDRNPKSPRHVHGLNHLGHRLFDGILGLMGRWTGQVDTGGNPPNGRNELIDLVPHEESTVSRFRSLAILDFNGTRIFFHFGYGMDNFIPSEIATGNLQYDVFQEPAPEQPRRAPALAGGHSHRHAEFFVQIGDSHLKSFPHGGRKRTE